MSYINTFVTIAKDCPVEKSEIPVSNRPKKPQHIIQYELLTKAPYSYDHETLIFEVYLQKEGLKHISEQEKTELWNQLFSKEHPCLRASSLIKRYGFGAHYNEQGKIALYPMESEEYERFVGDPAISKLAGMKTKR